MDVLGIGNHIVECARIAKMIELHGELFLERIFTEKEIAYCQGHKESVERFSGRWAAKEAILKSLGPGWGHGVRWLDLEVTTSSAGSQLVALGGGARVHAVRSGIMQIQVSVSQCRLYATAFAVALGRPPKTLPIPEIPPILPASPDDVTSPGV